MFMNPRARDFVDLYFIFQATNFTLERLILDAKAKFDWHIDFLLLGSQMRKVTTLTELPKMLKSFDAKDMQRFFLLTSAKILH